MAEQADFHIIVKRDDEAKDLYLRDIPMYRGQERWNCIRKKAYKFGTVEEAKEAVESLHKKDISVSYELEPKDKKDPKRRLFDVEIIFLGDKSTLVHWWGNDDLEITDRAFLLAKRANDSLRSIMVSAVEKNNVGN